MENRSITIDGKEYHLDDLTQEQKQIVQAIYKCDEEADRCKHIIAICHTAKQAYVNALGAQLNGEQET